MTTPQRAPYLILTSDRVMFGTRVRPSDVVATMDHYAPSAISPALWLSGPGNVDHGTVTYAFAHMARMEGGR